MDTRKLDENLAERPPESTEKKQTPLVVEGFASPLSQNRSSALDERQASERAVCNSNLSTKPRFELHVLAPPLATRADRISERTAEAAKRSHAPKRRTTPSRTLSTGTDAQLWAELTPDLTTSPIRASGQTPPSIPLAAEASSGGNCRYPKVNPL